MKFDKELTREKLVILRMIRECYPDFPTAGLSTAEINRIYLSLCKERNTSPLEGFKGCPILAVLSGYSPAYYFIVDESWQDIFLAHNVVVADVGTPGYKLVISILEAVAYELSKLSLTELKDEAIDEAIDSVLGLMNCTGLLSERAKTAIKLSLFPRFDYRAGTLETSEKMYILRNEQEKKEKKEN